MKRIFYLVALTICMSSCKKALDLEPRDKYSNTVVWKNINTLDLYINSLYSALYLYAEVGSVNQTDGFSDILKYSQTYMDTEHNRMNLFPNYLSPASAEVLSPWSASYERIRTLNEFIINSKKYGSAIDADQLKIRVAEIRFLRAFVYHKLVTRHGGVVMRVSDEVLDGPSDKNKKRATTAESWDWVISELKSVAATLPAEWAAEQTGRITKGAAYALMARSALYAERWDEAINAGKQVEALATTGGRYELLNKFDEVSKIPHNKELILAAYYKRPGLTNEFDRFFSPTGDMERYGGYASPTEELVSQFDISVDGKWERFDWNNEQHKLNPYVGRDPRFYATVLYNGASWKGRQIQTFVGGTDSYIEYFDGNSRNRTVTGYFIRKFLEEKQKDFVSEKGDQFWIEIRYAEVLTILSEAYAHKNDFTSAYRYLNLLRSRPSVDMPELVPKSSLLNYYKDLEKEKMCEFAFEGHRYWDLRRWKRAETVLNGTRMHGVEITPAGDAFTYSIVDCDKANHVFPNRYYTVPVPEFEMRNNLECRQDLAWQ
ncbi:MAG: RagB/SusD family nutrient uptake outer membrane protein [Pedobacter sp.]|uniref:RagB/SusD family nutrient uptake outer membrane protein n=1 Tax=Pedobacter sp. TaxID=1411316 RepID=UPI003562E39C